MTSPSRRRRDFTLIELLVVIVVPAVLATRWQAPIVEPRPANWSGPYLRMQPRLDGRGHASLYPARGLRSGTGYDLLSLGADGQQGGG